MQNTLEKKRIIKLGSENIIGAKLCFIAGPCSIENEDQIERIALEVASSGATVLRGGAYKPRTSPHSFQGLGKLGYEMLHKAAKRNNLYSISEVIDEKSLDEASSCIDILQIGSRNMQNYSLLKAAGKTTKPVLLKRGCAATYKELVLAAEYILTSGNPNVILCERGIRTFEPSTRNTLDLTAVPMLHEMCDLPVVVDPSHGTGKRSLVKPLALAAAAVGADGIMLETHYDPDNSYSDAEQTINIAQLKDIISAINKVI